ncbi:MAG: hypothetical protein V7L20_13370 [Nostoc sp.]|uniref:hypothetical protein n=1 Tax=Nostoc sp. TaxID=1180 RepID=UPI002FF7AA2E
MLKITVNKLSGPPEKLVTFSTGYIFAELFVRPQSQPRSPQKYVYNNTFINV